jgi:DNA repair exonuclease SbcCD nuclease subunit
MKILFTADIHIRLGSKNVPVEWARNRFQMFIDQFAEMQSKADIVIIGGDVFDRLPTMDEVELYFELVASLKKPTIIIPGNHEMMKKDTTFLSFLKRATNRLNKLVTICDEIRSDLLGGDIDIIPYNHLKQWAENYQDYDFQGRICVSHFRAEIPPHVKPEVNLDLFNRWQVVLAGDLHSYENSQRNILYPGSPYTTSFHRNLVDTGAILLDVDALSHVWLKFNLPQLLKKTIAAGEEPVATDFHHTVYEVEGDLQELGVLADSELVDKKVVKRSQDTQLILDPNLTLAEEVREYLTYILQLSDDAIAETIKEYYNYADKIESH